MARLKFVAYEIEHDTDLSNACELVNGIGARVIGSELDYEAECGTIECELPDGMTLSTFRTAYEEAGGC